jgi:endonuclease-8
VAEGDTVHLAARRLDAALRGERLVRTDFRVPAFATSDLSGQTVHDVAARGKHVLMRTDGGLTIHSHQKMDGAWELYRPGEGWGGGPGHWIRAILETEPWVAVGYRLGLVELLPTTREGDVVGHLGPDPLGENWDPEEAVRRLAADPGRAIGNALLDQRVMAGPGNIYRCEACFLRGMHPSTPVGDVPDLSAVVNLMKRLMEANRETGRQITTGDPRRGREHWVYGRTGRPCRRCGAPVQREAPARSATDRVVFWCPGCQPEPGSGPSGRRLRSSRSPEGAGEARSEERRSPKP